MTGSRMVRFFFCFFFCCFFFFLLLFGMTGSRMVRAPPSSRARVCGFRCALSLSQPRVRVRAVGGAAWLLFFCGWWCFFPFFFPRTRDKPRLLVCVCPVVVEICGAARWAGGGESGGARRRHSRRVRCCCCCCCCCRWATCCSRASAAAQSSPSSPCASAAAWARPAFSRSSERDVACVVKYRTKRRERGGGGQEANQERREPGASRVRPRVEDQTATAGDASESERSIKGPFLLCPVREVVVCVSAWEGAGEGGRVASGGSLIAICAAVSCSLFRAELNC